MVRITEAPVYTRLHNILATSALLIEKIKIESDFKNRINITVLYILMLFVTFGCSNVLSEDEIVSDTDRPALKGKLIYHNYTSYDAMDSRLYIYDFATNKLREISKNWINLTNPMNGHFSPDGRYVTFMAIGTNTNSWDIFIFDITADDQPENLTQQGDARDEDPKFSFDGTKICFKRNRHLAEININSKDITILSAENNEEYSMPYYTVDGKKIVFSGGVDDNSFIGLWNIEKSTMTKLYDAAKTTEYYPATVDTNSFYYTRHYSSTDDHDQLYKGYFDKSAATSLVFCNNEADYSDACPIANGWLILVSTKEGSNGSYDLYVANETSGAIYSLSEYNNAINTAKAELGPSYSEK